MLDINNPAQVTQTRNILGKQAASIVSDGHITAQERVGFINNVYRMILGRQPSPNEVTWWSRQLSQTGNLNQLIDCAIDDKLRGRK